MSENYEPVQSDAGDMVDPENPPKPAQCCGNCRWWNQPTEFVHPKTRVKTMIGLCSFGPIPDSSLKEMGNDAMWSTEGTSCPCHQPKESIQPSHSG